MFRSGQSRGHRGRQRRLAGGVHGAPAIRRGSRSPAGLSATAGCCLCFVSVHRELGEAPSSAGWDGLAGATALLTYACLWYVQLLAIGSSGRILPSAGMEDRCDGGEVRSTRAPGKFFGRLPISLYIVQRDPISPCKGLGASGGWSSGIRPNARRKSPIPESAPRRSVVSTSMHREGTSGLASVPAGRRASHPGHGSKVVKTTESFHP